MKSLQTLTRWWQHSRALLYKNWGETCLRRAQLDRSIRLCNRALTLNDALTDAYLTRGRAHYRAGSFAAAIADYDEVLRRGPRTAQVYVNRGLALYASGDPHGALGDLNLAIYLDPHEALAYNNRGLINEAQDNLTAAIADYSQAIRLNPLIAVAYTNRGGALVEFGDLRGAIADYRRYLALGGGWFHGNQTQIETLIDHLEHQVSGA